MSATSEASAAGPGDPGDGGGDAPGAGMGHPGAETQAKKSKQETRSETAGDAQSRERG